MNNIFYIIGVIVVVLLIAGFLGFRQPGCPQDDPFGHLKASAVDKGGQAILKIANAVQDGLPLDMPVDVRSFFR